jgi:hypothetical protein
LLVRVKFKAVVNFVLDVFPPIVATLALILAVYNYQTNLHIFENFNAKIVSISSNMMESKAELNNLKAGLLKNGSMHEEDKVKLDGVISKIIQNITQLQAKLKVVPTLDDQLKQVENQKLLPSSLPLTSTTTKPIPVIAQPNAASVPEAKPGSKTQVLKDAVDKLNKK